MDAERLERFSKQYRGLTHEALDRGDGDAAKAAQKKLFTQYRTMHRALRRILAVTVEASIAEFESRQAADAVRFAAAVDAGDAEGARRVLEEQRDVHRVFHDTYVDWFAELASKLQDAYGPERFYEILRETGAEFTGDFAKWVELTPEELLDSSVFLQLCHPDGELTVTEDDEKYTIHQHECGTGGRLMAEGRFDGPHGWARIPVANPGSLGKPGLPTYCAHCTVWNSVLSYETAGRPLWVIDHPLDHSCAIHIYKDPSRIPEEYLRAIRDERHTQGSSPQGGAEIAPS